MSHAEPPRTGADATDEAYETLMIIVTDASETDSSPPVVRSNYATAEAVRRDHRWKHVVRAFSMADKQHLLRVYPHGERCVIPLTEDALVAAIEYERDTYDRGERDRDHISRCSEWLQRIRGNSAHNNQ